MSAPARWLPDVHRSIAAALVLVLATCWSQSPVAPAAQTAAGFAIDVELIADPVVPKAVVLNWTRLLRRAGAASVRQVGRVPADAAAVEPLGKDRLLVRAMLLRSGSLRIGNSVIRPGDRRGLEQLLSRIRAEGPLAFAPKTEHWDLPEPMFVHVFRALAGPAQFQYEAVPLSELVDDVRARIELPIRVAEGAKKTVAERRVAVELKSVSLGTALAHVLGSAGLGFAPRRTGPSSVTLMIDAASALQRPWPVGWKAAEPPGQLVPRLFERVTIPPRRLPAMQLIASLAVHCRVPFLVDHLALAKQKIDIGEVVVDVGCRNRALALCFKDALRPASLTYRVKVDEAGKPLVVIEPLIRLQTFPRDARGSASR